MIDSLKVCLLGLLLISSVRCNPILGLNDVLINITRLEESDSFFIKGDCGVTRCNEVSSGTALSFRPPGSGPPCGCKCRPTTPLFREDLLQCVNDIPECQLVEFGAGDNANRIPFIYIPLSGQIVHPSRHINFQDVDNAICAVSGAQFLTKTGWSNLRNDVDGDVPFGLFRDEGKTFLQWHGSEITRKRMTGHLILARLTCRIESNVFAPCVAFRVAGSPPDLSHDVTEVWFSHGELSSKNDKQSTEETGNPAGLAIIFCIFVVLLLYGSLLLLHVRNKNKKPLLLDSESIPYKDDVLPNTKTNPLLSIESFFKDSQGIEGLTARADSVSTTSNNSDSSGNKPTDDYVANQECTGYNRTTNATIHHAHRVEMSEERCHQVGIVEKIPELHVAIVEASEPLGHLEIIDRDNFKPTGSQRKKLYFNPVFFEIHYLKNPPPAAVEFLSKIREVIKIAKDKMRVKRFVPMLPTIPEEDLKKYEIPFPYESLTKTHSAVSLKRDQSKRKNYCNGCPGCTDMKFKKTYMKTMSEKEFCKDCVTNEFKQNIVRKWLDDVPLILSQNVQNQHQNSISRMEGTPSSIKPDKLPNKISINVVGENTVRRMSVPPPPPPENKSEIKISDNIEEEYVIPLELKEKMNAVISELSKFRKIAPIHPRSSSPVSEVATPFIPDKVFAVTPKLVIPTPPKYAKQLRPKIMSFDKTPTSKIKNNHFEVDSLERTTNKRRASLSNIDFHVVDRIQKRRSSIIAMEELEPMKKIHEMNSRLSRSFQEISVANLTFNDMISEIYVNDSNTLSSVSSDSSNKFAKIKYTEPLTKPGQLVIEVEGPPKKEKSPDYEDFDPDTLDRKPGKLKIFQENLPPNKTIDRMFLKPQIGQKLKEGSLLEIFEAKNRNVVTQRSFKNDPSIHSYVPKTVMKFYDDDYKPPLPPKKIIGTRSSHRNSIINLDPSIKFRCTRSEPYAPNWTDEPASLESNSSKRITIFGSPNQLNSLESNYENYYNTDEVDFKYQKKSPRKPVKYRIRRTEHRIKTEDSGYLSSDSNESRHKGKFILQVRDKDISELISDTDDLDSICDAQSESGGESIETSSVFFDNCRRLTLMNDRCDDLDQMGDSGFHGDSFRNEETTAYTSFDRI